MIKFLSKFGAGISWAKRRHQIKTLGKELREFDFRISKLTSPTPVITPEYLDARDSGLIRLYFIAKRQQEILEGKL